MPACGWLQRVRHNTYTVCYVRLGAISSGGWEIGGLGRPTDGRVLGGAASTTSGHQPVMKYSVLHAQPVS